MTQKQILLLSVIGLSFGWVGCDKAAYKFEVGDMVITRIGGHVGQVITIDGLRSFRSSIRYNVRLSTSTLQTDSRILFRDRPAEIKVLSTYWFRAFELKRWYGEVK